jgi:hypothetical protein
MHVDSISSTNNDYIILDPTVENARKWENAYTETIFGSGEPPFTTVIYSKPQVAWNGTHWVSHELKAINGTTAFLRTPSCAYVIEKENVLLLDPNGTSLHAGGMGWIVEQYSALLGEWRPTVLKDASVGCNSTHVWQKWTFIDDSRRTLYIGCDNKQTIVFTARSSATYRMVWRFIGINASEVIYQNGTHIELGKGCERIYKNFDLNKLMFFDNRQLSLSIRWPEVARLFYKEFSLSCFRTGHADLSLVYGDWILNFDESLIIDPETQTFNSEAALDGCILEFDPFYPPEYKMVWSWEVWAGQDKDPSNYWIFRGYLSFDTSSIRDYAVVTSATLKIKTMEDHSVVDFATRVMSGAQPIYGSSLETTDWGCGTIEIASWPSSQYPGNNVYVNISIPKDHINTKGRTQFELKSDREGTKPCGVELDEYIIFHSAESSGNEPKLEVVWLPHTEYNQGVYWYYWNHSSSQSQKVAISLFGGYAYQSPPRVRILSVFTQDSDFTKEKAINGLYENGFDIISPKKHRDAQGEYIDYDKNSDWIYNATTWLLGKGYHYICLFGFSAGGVATAYDIQKDYASIFSAAMITSAPVDWDSFSSDPIFQSAHTAHKVKTCTSFIAGVNATEYPQMSFYFNNTNVHKEWHKWNSGHDIFPFTCLTHPGETVSQATDRWFTPHSVPLRSPSFEGRLRSVYGCADWETNRAGWRELRGDVDANGDCNILDLSAIGKANGAVVGDPKYDWCLDLNGDGKINQTDYNLASEDYGKKAERLDGSYSWYTSGGGEYQMWQWLNHSVNLLKGKQVTFQFWFKPKTLPSGAYAQARIYYIDHVGERIVCSDNVYYTEAKWYKVTVTANLPTTTTTIKVIILGRPDFKAWVDNGTLTTSP